MKGRTWCIEFLDDAKKDGDVSVTWKVIRQGQQTDVRGTWEGYKAGMTARQKAERLEDRLRNDPNMSAMVGVHRAGNTVCMQLKDGAPFDDLAGVAIGDETGQTFRVYDDPDVVPMKETVRLRLSGQPASPAGVVRLGVGIIPSPVSVETHGPKGPIPIATLLDTLAKSFNRAFGKLGYKATVEEDQVVIPEVPCDLGATAGTDDHGLKATLAVEDPGEPMAGEVDRVSTLRDMIQALHIRLASVETKPHGHSHAESIPKPHEHGHEEGGGAKPVCTGAVLQVGAGAKARYTLICAGTCEHGGECSKRRSVNHHGGVREWCGCDDVEPTTCHVVLYTPGPGEGGGPPQVLCAGACDNKKPCTPVAVPIPLPPFLPQMWLHYCVC